jgi:hypothetical protein
VKTVGRAAPVPVAVRLCVAVAGVAGMAAGSGADTLRSSAVVGLALLALMPALLPRGIWPSLAIGVIICWYLVETSTAGHIDAWRPIAVAACVYVVHTGSALAAVLPYDAVVGPGVLGPWALRAGGVILLTAAFGVFVLALPRLLGSHHLFGATLGGIAVLAVTAIYVVYLGARDPGGRGRAVARRVAGVGARRRRPAGGHVKRPDR